MTSQPDPRLSICPKCGQYNDVQRTNCIFCGQPLAAPDATWTNCARCGQLFPASTALCPRCGARRERATVTQPIAHTDPQRVVSPQGLARVGYLLLIALGGVLILGGAVYGGIAFFATSEIADRALAIAAFFLGILFVWHSTRALRVRWWKDARLPSMWIWLGGMVLTWAAGLLASTAWAPAKSLLLPPLIAIAAALFSMLFLSATLHGLQRRQPEPSPPAQRHVVYLSTALGAVFSTGLALIAQLFLVVLTYLTALIVAYLLDASQLYRLLRNVIDDPAFLDQAETVALQSPWLLLGLAGFVVLVAPLSEEICKGIPLLFFAHRRATLTERLAILLGLAGGVGFAFVENIGYISMLVDEWGLIFWFRAGAAVMHGAASGFIGRAWYRARGQGKWGPALLDFARGLGIHALWNIFALLVGWFGYQEQAEGTLIVIFVGLAPLAALFVILAQRGIWIDQTG